MCTICMICKKKWMIYSLYNMPWCTRYYTTCIQCKSCGVEYMLGTSKNQFDNSSESHHQFDNLFGTMAKMSPLMLLLPAPYPQPMWQARQLKLARLLQKPMIGKWETRPKLAEPRGCSSFPWQWRLLAASIVWQQAWWGELGKLWQGKRGVKKENPPANFSVACL